jgi:hypothetical protein
LSATETPVQLDQQRDAYGLVLARLDPDKKLSAQAAAKLLMPYRLDVGRRSL